MILRLLVLKFNKIGKIVGSIKRESSECSRFFEKLRNSLEDTEHMGILENI